MKKNKQKAAVMIVETINSDTYLIGGDTYNKEEAISIITGILSGFRILTPEQAFVYEAKAKEFLNMP